MDRSTVLELSTVLKFQILLPKTALTATKCTTANWATSSSNKYIHIHLSKHGAHGLFGAVNNNIPGSYREKQQTKRPHPRTLSGWVIYPSALNFPPLSRRRVRASGWEKPTGPSSFALSEPSWEVRVHGAGGRSAAAAASAASLLIPHHHQHQHHLLLSCLDREHPIASLLDGLTWIILIFLEKKIIKKNKQPISARDRLCILR